MINAIGETFLSLSQAQHLKDNPAAQNDAAELAKLRDELRFLRCKQQDLTERLEASKQEAADLRTALAARTDELAQLRKLLDRERTPRASMDSIVRQRGVLEASLKQLRREFDEQFRQLRIKESCISSLDAELAETRRSLKAIRTSWSWKVTRPLRFAADMLLWVAGLPNVVDQRFSQLRSYAQYFCGGWRMRNSHLFDSAYYLKQNPDVANSASRSRPLLHFFLFGAAEGRDPHPLFDVKYYLERNPDVASSWINPLLHYVYWGAEEGRDPHPLFDSSFYLNKYPNVRKEQRNPLVHYMDRGAAAGLDPNPSFNTAEYLARNPDIVLECANPLVHYSTTQFLQSTKRTQGSEMKQSETRLRMSLRSAFLESARLQSHDSSPVVSVIIPCFNQGHYLEDAVLSSYLACSCPIEIIVVDDGSTQAESIRAIDELAAKYNFRLIRQVNTGLAGARNTGLKMAQGNFIQFLDADDFLGPNKIDIQIKEFEADPSTDICVCEYDACNGEGEARCIMQPSTIAGFSLSREDFLLRWERGLSIPIHCALFRRELLEKIEFRTVTQAGKEDWIFWIELSSKPRKFHFNSAPLATYRIHGKNATTDYETMGLDFLRATMYLVSAGLSNCDGFLQASIDHFRSFYLGEIRKEGITDIHDKTAAERTQGD